MCSLGRFADVFTGRMKLFLVFLFLGSTASFLWFSLLCQGIIPFSKGKYFICAIILCVFVATWVTIIQLSPEGEVNSRWIYIVGEERWIYTSTLRVSVYIHRSSPTLREIVVVVFSKSDG